MSAMTFILHFLFLISMLTTAAIAAAVPFNETTFVPGNITDLMANLNSTTASGNWEPGDFICGLCYNLRGDALRLTASKGCNNLDDGEYYLKCANSKCRTCITFPFPDCYGRPQYWDGFNDEWKEAKWGQSHFCDQ